MANSETVIGEEHEVHQLNGGRKCLVPGCKVTWDGKSPRVVIACRLSQESSGQTGMFTQDKDAVMWAKRQGFVIVGKTEDTVSSRKPPWERKNLGPWRT